jgi:hypothetical protein
MGLIPCADNWVRFFRVVKMEWHIMLVCCSNAKGVLIAQAENKKKRPDERFFNALFY